MWNVSKGISSILTVPIFNIFVRNQILNIMGKLCWELEIYITNKLRIKF